ncbi:MAG: MFS transporter [Pseudomonadota bacterium]
MNTKLRTNIGVLYIFSFFWVAMVVIPVMVPLFESKGLSLAEVFYLQSIFALVVVILEIPSGYYADMFGRKQALVLGSLFHGLGFTWLFFADGFVALVVFETLVGIGLSLLSGADLSLLYDSQDALAMDPAEKTRGIANMRFIKSCGEGCAALLASILVIYSLDAIVIANALFAWCPLVLSLLLTEAPFTRMAQGQHVANLKQVVGHLMVSDRLLRLICLNITFFSLMTFYVVWMLQPYWGAQGVPLALFGLLWAAQSFLFAIATRLTIPMEDRFGAVPVLVVMGALPVVGYLGMALTGGVLGVCLSFLFFISRGINQVILTDALNRRVPGAFRATANSMTSFMFRGVYIVTGPLVGYLIGAVGMQATLLVLCAVSALLFGTLLVPMLAAVRGMQSAALRSVTTE